MQKFISARKIVEKILKKGESSSSSSPSEPVLNSSGASIGDSKAPSEIKTDYKEPVRFPSPSNSSSSFCSQTTPRGIPSPTNEKTECLQEKYDPSCSSSCSSGYVIDVHPKKNCSMCHGTGYFRKLLTHQEEVPENLKGLNIKNMKGNIRIKEVCGCCHKRSQTIAKNMNIPKQATYQINVVLPAK